MRRESRIRPLVFLGIVLAMTLGVASAALADEPAVEEVEAPVGVEVVEEGEVIPRDDERPPAVEPMVEPEGEEPMVIAPAVGMEEPMIVNPEGTIGIEETVIAPAPGSSSGGWSADDYAVLATSTMAALVVGAGLAFLATRRHYRHQLLPH